MYGTTSKALPVIIESHYTESSPLPEEACIYYIIDLRQGRQVKSSNQLAQLNPCIDALGTLRVRLQNTHLNYETKRSIIMQHIHRLTRHIIEDCHWKLNILV